VIEIALGLLFLGPGSFAVGCGLGYALGRSPGRMFLVAGLGVAIMLALFVWAWVESSPTEACWECGEVFGRWMSPMFVFALVLNSATWVAGAVVGWAIRQARSNGARPIGPLY
jgi:hypothetical protein